MAPWLDYTSGYYKPQAADRKLRVSIGLRFNCVLHFLADSSLRVDLWRIIDRAHSRIPELMEWEDLFQEVMVRALAAREQFRGNSKGEFLAWLSTIASHVVSDRLRELARHPPLTALHEAIQVGQVSKEDSLTLRDLMEVLLARLSPFETALLQAHYQAGFSLSQIARILNRSPEAVRQIHHRLVKRLREELNTRSTKPSPD